MHKLKNHLFIPIILTAITLLVVFIVVKSPSKKDTGNRISESQSDGLHVTPKSIESEGIGYDPEVYPIEKYVNDEFNFTFNYQKGEIRIDELKSKELLNVDLYICAGSCSMRASVTVLPITNLDEALDYRIQNEDLVDSIGLELIEITDTILDDYPAKMVVYKISYFSYYDIVTTKGNYSYSIFGPNAREVANTFKFTN